VSGLVHLVLLTPTPSTNPHVSTTTTAHTCHGRQGLRGTVGLGRLAVGTSREILVQINTLSRKGQTLIMERSFIMPVTTLLDLET
jgi:cytochrome c553